MDGAFYQLRDKAEADIRALVEEVAKRKNAPGTEAQKVGDLYAGFLDEPMAEKLGIEPVAKLLAKVEALEDKSGFVRLLGALEREGVDGLFNLHVDTDAKHSDRYIAYLGQDGIGLPDESYYRDEKFAKVRDAYVAHVGRTLGLAKLDDPEGASKQVMAVETRLAKDHWDRVKDRDDTLTYNKVDRKGLPDLAPGFDWDAWFGAIGAEGVEEVIVREPGYFKAMAKAVDEVPISRWKSWLSWNVIRRLCPVPEQALRRRVVRLLRQDPDRRPRESRPMEARGGPGGRLARRGGRQAVRRRALPSRGQGPHAGPGQEPDRGVSARHPGPRLDERRDQGEGPRQARQVLPQDRLSRQVARLLGPRNQA